jgi:hypothetical protein
MAPHILPEALAGWPYPEQDMDQVIHIPQEETVKACCGGMAVDKVPR